MSIRHLVFLALLATAGAAQAQSVANPRGVQIQAPPPLVLEPAPAAILPVAVPEATEVPEPSSIALLLAGAIGVGALRRRSK